MSRGDSQPATGSCSYRSHVVGLFKLPNGQDSILETILVWIQVVQEVQVQKNYFRSKTIGNIKYPANI